MGSGPGHFGSGQVWASCDDGGDGPKFGFAGESTRSRPRRHQPLPQGAHQITEERGTGFRLRDPGRSCSTARPSTSSCSKEIQPLGGKGEAKVTGLDAGVVRAALAAGVPLEHLEIMGDMVKKKPGRLADVPRHPGARDRAQRALSESEEEDLNEPVAENLEEPDPVGRALVRLTNIVQNLTESKQKKKATSLEEALDGCGSSGGAGADVVGLSFRRQAQAYRQLQKALIENPKDICKSISANMREDFALRRGGPGCADLHATWRGWAEHRSRIQNFPSVVRWSWAVAGALDALESGSQDECKARLMLMLAQADQQAIDRGSWLRAQEFSLEAPPPYSSFAAHQAITAAELQHSKLIDPRWVNTFMSRLREADDYADRRKKLDSKQRPNPAWSSEGHQEPAYKKGAGKTKKGFGKKGEGGGADAPPRSELSQPPSAWSPQSSLLGPLPGSSTSARAGHSLGTAIGGRGANIGDGGKATGALWSEEVVSPGRGASPPVRGEVVVGKKVPGQNASRATILRSWSAVPRLILRQQTPFSSFLRSLLERPQAPQERATAPVWPMPLPYFEVFKPGGSPLAEEASFKKSICLMVGMLSWLHLRQPPVAPREICGLHTLTDEQAAVVSRLERLSGAWKSYPDIPAEEMGRGAAKIELFEEITGKLEASFTALHAPMPYASQKKKKFSSGAAQHSRPTVLGRSSTWASSRESEFMRARLRS